MPASATARFVRCSSVIAGVAPFACMTYTARCAAGNTLSAGAPFTQASSNQLRAVQPYKRCDCVISSEAGSCDRPQSLCSCRNARIAGRSPTRQLEAKGRHCRPTKAASHRVIKPVSMYRTQVAAIADLMQGRPGAPNNATPEAENSPGCKGVRWRIHNQTRNTVRSRLESCSRCSTTQRRNQRRLRKLHRDMRGDIPFVERLQRSTPFAVVLYGHQRCPTIARQCSLTGEARLALLSITRHRR